MLVQLRTTPGAVELVVLSVGVGRLPISATSTAPTAPETMQWAQGYSGCIGVSMSTMRGMGDHLVREGVWLINPLRWMKGPKIVNVSKDMSYRPKSILK